RDLGAANSADGRAAWVQIGQRHLFDAGRLPVRPVVAEEGDLAVEQLAGLRHDPEDRLGGHALAAAALAHHTERLASVDLEADAVERLDRALAQEEVGLDVLQLDQAILDGCRVGHKSQTLYGSAASRRPSPMKLN